MTKRLISRVSFLINEIGYSEAEVDGCRIFVPGTNGFGCINIIIKEDIACQSE